MGSACLRPSDLELACQPPASMAMQILAANLADLGGSIEIALAGVCS